MNARVWLSFDLGVRGDYESLYAWLDEHRAKECGPGVGYLVYRYRENFLEELRGELEQVLTGTPRPRIYVVHSVARDKPTGQWVIGGRKSPPWTGFGSGDAQEVDR